MADDNTARISGDRHRFGKLVEIAILDLQALLARHDAAMVTKESIWLARHSMTKVLDTFPDDEGE